MISQTSEYALRAVVYLATRPGGASTSAHEIAESTRVPVGYLQKVLRSLAKAEILTAQRGSGGGFSLAKVPTAIRVLDVLRATDGSLARIERCPLGITGHMKLCSLHRMIDQEIAHAEQTFSTTTIADLIADNPDFAPLCRTNIPQSVPLRINLGRPSDDPE
jgi:Rrf2 family protein